MYTGGLQSLGLMLANFLGIPPGVSLRRTYGNRGTSANGNGMSEILANHDFINSIVDITSDDVCVGNSPVYVSGLSSISSPVLKQRTEDICAALNKIVRWAAVDLLKHGLSMYVFHSYEDHVAGRVKASLVPFVEDVKIYMKRDGSIVFYDTKDRVVENVLVFLNYSKESLVKIESGFHDNSMSDAEWDEMLYEVTPEPIQLKNVSSVAQDLYGLERSMYSYRNKLARIVRFITVDVGNSQGERTQEIIDDISQTINADSQSLQPTMTPNTDFADGISIHPHRKGIGKPELVENVPDFDISKMADLDYTLGRLFLATRFPKTYADFNTNLNETTVSLIRGDIRYARMVAHCRFNIEDTINSWFRSSSKELDSSDVYFRLVKLPTSEDTDVVDTLTSFAEFSNNFIETLDNAETREAALNYLQSMESLLDDTSNLSSVQNWFELMRSYINDKFDALDRDEENAAAQEAAALEGLGTSLPADEGAAEDAVAADMAAAAEEFEAPPAVPE